MMTQGELGFKYEEDKQGVGMTGMDGYRNRPFTDDVEPGGRGVRGGHRQTGIG